MRKKTKWYAGVLGLTTAGAIVLSSGAASSHGYTDLPISRQKLCANGTVTNCGDIQYEPQSVEGPKGFPGQVPPTARSATPGSAASPNSAHRRRRPAPRGRPPR